MIKGNKRKNYNEFEEELLSIAGDIQNCSGLHFFFEHIYQTFEIAEKAICLNGKKYNDSFNKENFDTKQSISLYDAGHVLKGIPLTEMLHKAHFITLHSEFENSWKEIIKIHNHYYPSRAYAPLNDKFLSPKTSNCILDKVVKKHLILISYNYVRNKIVHQKAVTISPESSTLMRYIDSKEMQHLKVSVDNINVNFEIENSKFIKDYGNRILNFISDIADTSFSERQVSNNNR